MDRHSRFGCFYSLLQSKPQTNIKATPSVGTHVDMLALVPPRGMQKIAYIIKSDVANNVIPALSMYVCKTLRSTVDHVLGINKVGYREIITTLPQFINSYSV